MSFTWIAIGIIMLALIYEFVLKPFVVRSENKIARFVSLIIIKIPTASAIYNYGLYDFRILDLILICSIILIILTT